MPFTVAHAHVRRCRFLCLLVATARELRCPRRCHRQTNKQINKQLQKLDILQFDILHFDICSLTLWFLINIFLLLLRDCHMSNDGPRGSGNDYICGVVEGFYGHPWSHAERKHLFEKMKKQNQNCYLYAPKHDKKHRQKWRIKYSEKELENLE